MENVSISVVVLLSWILERFSNVSILLVFCWVSFCFFGMESFVEFVFFEEVVLVILEGVFFFIVVGVLLLLLYFVSVSISMQVVMCNFFIFYFCYNGLLVMLNNYYV